MTTLAPALGLLATLAGIASALPYVRDMLNGGPGTDLECTGTTTPDPGAPDVDTVTDCE